jgi:RimJ/RimL family protein N-acetyltransferase
MFTQEIICSQNLKLVKPDVERDVPISINWLKGEIGKQTLRLMGNVVDDNYKSDAQEEINRYKDFLTKEDQLNWMIEHEGQVIGTVWADLVEKNNVKAPSVHILIGDVSARGKGVGIIAEGAVVDYLKQQGFDTIYSRALISNKKMMHIAIDKLGYKKDGEAYVDKDGLVWQNQIMEK